MVEDKGSCWSHRVPHDEVLCHGLQQDMIEVAFLDSVKTVGNGDAAGQLEIVALEVHQRDGEQG